jgi:hypothetical protein
MPHAPLSENSGELVDAMQGSGLQICFNWNKLFVIKESSEEAFLPFFSGTLLRHQTN